MLQIPMDVKIVAVFKMDRLEHWTLVTSSQANVVANITFKEENVQNVLTELSISLVLVFTDVSHVTVTSADLQAMFVTKKTVSADAIQESRVVIALVLYSFITTRPSISSNLNTKTVTRQQVLKFVINLTWMFSLISVKSATPCFLNFKLKSPTISSFKNLRSTSLSFATEIQRKNQSLQIF